MVAPDPIAFSIFGIDIMWYGVLIGTGFLLAVAITYIRAPKFGIEQDFILTITIAVIPSAIILSLIHISIPLLLRLHLYVAMLLLLETVSFGLHQEKWMALSCMPTLYSMKTGRSSHGMNRKI